MNFKRVRAVARKEALHILRDTRSMIMALALPVLMLILFGWALTLDVDRIPLLVYDQDQSARSRSVISLFEGSRFFEVLGEVDGFEAIRRQMDRGHCMAGLVIPPGFARTIQRGSNAELQLILDGSDSNTASIGLGYAESILREFSAGLSRASIHRGTEIQLRTPIEVRLRIWYNSQLESKNYIVPGLVAVILMIIAALLTSLTIAREWEMGTMEQLLSTPLRPAELVLGKMSAYFVLGAVDTLIAILLGVGVFGVPLRGSLLLLAGSCFVFLLGALCWGILLSAAVRSQLLAYQLGMITSFLPAFLLSGFIFAIENMPAPVQAATHVVPARYFITVLRGIFLKGAEASVLGKEILFLSLFAGAVFLAATRRLKGKVG